jgi:hypothetical protein
MNSFLQQVALDILSKHGTELDNIRILFPNRRSLLFFQKSLASLAGRPIWTPGLMTLDAWVKEKGGQLIPDELTQLTLLYKSWSAIGNTESFDDFYNLGRVLLQDMSSIHESLADCGALFRDLQLLADYQWEESMEGEKALKDLVTALQKRKDSIQITQVWKQMGRLFTDFEARLLSKGMSTASMVYRNMAENISEMDWTEEMPHVYAVGFYQGNDCVQKILNGFKNIHFYWMNIDLTIHQALDFEFPLEHFRSDNQYRSISYDLKEDQKNIKIIAAPGQQLQIQYIHRTLSQIPEDQWNSTCITMAEQGLLLPLVQSIPDEIDKVNISMGLSLADTQAYTFTIRYLKLIAAWSSKGSVGSRFLGSVLKHPLIERHVPKPILDLLKKRFITWEELNELDTTWADWIKPEKGLALIDQLCALLEHLFQLPLSEINKAGIYEMYQQLRRLTSMDTQLQVVWSASFIEGYVRRILKQGKIMLPGEPLDGLQILGLPESVHLGFQRIVFLDVNEGKIPSAKHETILPYTLSQAYGLPGAKEKIATQAYLFWSSVCQAKETILLYNSTISGDLKAEPSRWLQRLIMAQHPPKWSISSFDVSIKTALPTPKAISFSVKDPIVKQQMDTFLKDKHISATSLNNWLDCTLKFYLLHVLGYREPISKDEWGNHTIGEIVHQVMDTLYQPFLKQVITTDILATIYERIPKVVQDTYLKRNDLLAYQLKNGSHQLLLKIIEKMVTQIVNIDKPHTETLQIVQFEQEVKHQLNIDDRSIQFLGRMDRIDYLSGKPRIIDYKSGKAKKVAITHGKFDKLWNRKEREKEVFQTIFYTWLFHQLNPETSIPEAHLYFYQLGHSSRLKSNETQVLVDKLPITSEILSEFENGLLQLLEELTDSELVFSQTEHIHHCEYCTFKTMCQRG